MCINTGKQRKPIISLELVKTFASELKLIIAINEIVAFLFFKDFSKEKWCGD